MKLSIKELVTFSMLGAMMYASKVIMEMLPNIHLLGVFVITLTAVYRKKALYPIYIYVLLLGLFSGFATWWISHLYIWTLLWGAVMILPKKIPQKLLPIIYMLLCAAHGFLYGVLYAPLQAVLYGMDFRATVSWVVAGFPFDAVHGISNFCCGALIYPLILLLRRINNKKVTM